MPSPRHRGIDGSEIRRLLGEGLSVRAVASRMDCSRGTVQYHARSAVCCVRLPVELARRWAGVEDEELRRILDRCLPR